MLKRYKKHKELLQEIEKLKQENGQLKEENSKLKEDNETLNTITELQKKDINKEKNQIHNVSVKYITEPLELCAKVSWSQIERGLFKYDSEENIVKLETDHLKKQMMEYIYQNLDNIMDIQRSFSPINFEEELIGRVKFLPKK